MNILIVNMSIDPLSGGGTAERARQLVYELQDLENTNAKVLSTTAGLNANSTFLGNEQYILLPCLSKRWYVPSPNLRTILNSLKWADVIILMGNWTILNAMVYFVNKFIKRPYVYCPAGALHVFGRSRFIKHLYNIIVGKKILDHATKVIAIPNNEKELFIKLGVPKVKTLAIPNGISLSDFLYSSGSNFRASLAIGNAPFLLFMGRLNQIKGPDILLDAFAKVACKFPTWQLVIAGPNDGMEKQLRRACQEYNLYDRVHFPGYLSGAEKADAYYASDILVIPSRLEAMSIVAMEGGGCGTPVLMTNVCGFSELVDAGGAVEVPVSVDRLADELSNLMGNNFRLKDMGVNARKFIEENYTWKIAARRHLDLCRDICNQV